MISEHLFACNEQGVFESGVSVLLNTKTSGESTNRFDLPWLVAAGSFHQKLALREFGRLDKLYWTVDDVGLLIVSEACDCHIFFWISASWKGATL
jgi:hypothetical protein